jgi:hypothetical protein
MREGQGVERGGAGWSLAAVRASQSLYRFSDWKCRSQLPDEHSSLPRDLFQR